MFSGRLVYLKLPFVNKIRWIEKFVYWFLWKYVYQFFGEPFRSFPRRFIVQLCSIKQIILLMCPDASSEDFGANVAGWEVLGRAPCPPAQVRFLPRGRAPPAPGVCVPETRRGAHQLCSRKITADDRQEPTMSSKS